MSTPTRQNSFDTYPIAMSMIQYHSYIIAMNSFHSFLTFRNGDREMRGIVSGPLTFNDLTFEDIDHGPIIPEYILYLIDKGTNRSGKHLGYKTITERLSKLWLLLLNDNRFHIVPYHLSQTKWRNYMDCLKRQFDNCVYHEATPTLHPSSE